MTKNNLSYPVLFTRQEEGGFVATFRDIPEAIAQGETEEETIQEAYSALDTAMEFYIEDQRPIPEPSKVEDKEVLLHLSTVGSYCIRIHNELVAPLNKKFKRGDLVCKSKGSNWHGRVVGEYSTALTPEGYAVECAFEPGSVQIYPASALEPWDGEVLIAGSTYRVEYGVPTPGDSVSKVGE